MKVRHRIPFRVIAAFAIAAILMVLTFLINLAANFAGRKLKK